MQKYQKIMKYFSINFDNVDMLNADGVEDETVGQQYLETHNNWPAQMWIQTSYNTLVETFTIMVELHLEEIMQV